MNDKYNDMFGGIGRLYGDDSLLSFKNTHVCVIGIGGVGTWAVEALARSGFENITIIDLDDVCITNINRQLAALNSTIGKPKVRVMKDRLLDINPNINCNVIEDFITKDNIKDYINSDINYVIDCIDRADLKAALIAHCRRNKIKIVTAGAAGGKKDPTQIKISDLSQTIQDPLLAKVRYILRREYNFPKNKKLTIPSVFSSEQLNYPSENGNTSHKKPIHLKNNCSSGFGSVTMVTAGFAFACVAKIIDMINKSKS